MAFLISLDSAEMLKVNWSAEIPLAALQAFTSDFK